MWVRDHADTEDLSVQTEASSVYTESGRTLEHELGNGSMVSNVATVESRMEKVIDGTYDGAYESCKMYGKSLVNLMTNCKDEYVVRYHDPSNPNHTVANISMMKPNTEYTLFYKAKYRTEGEGAGTSGVLHIATSIEQGFISTSQGLTTEYKQYVFKFTTSSVVDCFTFKSNGNYFAIKECVLLKGNYTDQGIPYFEGLCDVKAPILKNVGKNLFNPINIFYGIGKLNNDGSIFIERWSAGGNGWGETKMNCTSIPSGTYYVNILQNGEFVQNRNAVWVCNSSGKLIANVPNRTLFTINEPATRIDLVIQDTNNQTITNTVYTVHIEKVSELPQKDSSYEAYKTNILETSNDLVLRGLPSGIRDTYDCLTGEYIRRVGERDYQESDESDSNVITDLVKTHYELAEPIVTQIEPPTTPFAYENGHIILESGHEGQSLLPALEYQTVVSRSGQVAMIDKTIQQHERKITLLEKMLVQNIIDIEYKNTLLALKLEINEVI